MLFVVLFGLLVHDIWTQNRSRGKKAGKQRKYRQLCGKWVDAVWVRIKGEKMKYF